MDGQANGYGVGKRLASPWHGDGALLGHTTPHQETIDTTDPKAVVERWLDALERMDTRGLTEPLADDATVEAEALRRPIPAKQVLDQLTVGAMDVYDSIGVHRKKIIAEGHGARPSRSRIGSGPGTLGRVIRMVTPGARLHATCERSTRRSLQRRAQ